jgi:allene oxide cyclase
MFTCSCFRNVLAALPLSIGICLASAGANAETTETLSFIERVYRADGSPAYTNIDLDKPGTSQGDMMVFQSDVVDSTTKKLVGHDSGWCVRTWTSKQLSECTFTLTLADGEISVQGPSDRHGETVLAVTGGTGKYSGARGELKLNMHVDPGFDNYLTYILRY